MCAACLEYIKDKLTLNEFRSALRETTTQNPTHFFDVNKIISSPKTPDEQKQELKKLNSDKY